MFYTVRMNEEANDGRL